MKKAGFIVLVNLAAITISSFSPLYADTHSDNLRQREAALIERAVTLSGREIDLDDMEQKLNRKAAELEEQAKNIQAQKAENTIREIELEDMMRHYKKALALLTTRNSEAEVE